MSDQTGPVEGGMSADILNLIDDMGNVGPLAKELVRLAKIIDALLARVDDLEKYG